MIVFMAVIAVMIVFVFGLVIMTVIMGVFVRMPVIVSMRRLMFVIAVIMFTAVIVVMMIVMFMAAIVMPMIMMPMIVFGMIVLAMRMFRGRFSQRLVSPAIGLERRLYMHHLRAELAGHLLQHVIPADAEAFGQNFSGRVAVADVIGEPHHQPRVGRAQFGELFWSRDDLDQPAILQHQRVAAAQMHGVRQVEQEFRAAHALHGHAAAMAFVIVENDGVGGLRLPGPFGRDEIRADHAAVSL